MTRGKASTSAWGRPGSPQRPIGTTRSRTCAARPVLRVGRGRCCTCSVAAIDEGPRDRELLALLYDGLGAAR
jgi:hypothetical protein